MSETGETTGSTLRKKIAHPDFAQRMYQACDGNPHVPPANFGRLGWFKTQLEERFDHSVTIETVRKWFAGESRPREKPMQYLSQLLAVDHSWLALGVEPEVSEKERKVRNASADGAVNVIAGLIAIGGGHPAFPFEDDARASDEKIDLYAIIRGAQYAFHIVLGLHHDDSWQFTVPVEALNTLVLGVMVEGTNVTVLELDREGIEQRGRRKAGHVEVTAAHGDDGAWTRITSFSHRL